MIVQGCFGPVEVRDSDIVQRFSFGSWRFFRQITRENVAESIRLVTGEGFSPLSHGVYRIYRPETATLVLVK